MSIGHRSNELFVRPANNFPDRMFNRLLPPQPVGQLEYEIPSTLRVTYRDHLVVNGQILLTLIVGGLQIWLFNWTAQAPVVLLMKQFWKLEPLMGSNFQILRWLIVVLICGCFLYAIRRDSRQPWLGINLSMYRWHVPLALWAHFINSSTQRVTVEEQWYREGAETWTRKQRLASNLVFGFSHITTIFYPIAIYLPLCLLGHTLNQVYLQELKRTYDRDEALTRAIVVHRLYNWSAPILFVPYILVFIALA